MKTREEMITEQRGVVVIDDNHRGVLGTDTSVVIEELMPILRN